jgi:hypothetical protein
MKTYAIFIDNCEIHVDLREGDIDSIPSIRDEIAEKMKENPTDVFGKAGGYVEQYPFYQADWEIMGSNLPVGFDQSTILEVSQ